MHCTPGVPGCAAPKPCRALACRSTAHPLGGEHPGDRPDNPLGDRLHSACPFFRRGRAGGLPADRGPIPTGGSNPCHSEGGRHESSCHLARPSSSTLAACLDPARSPCGRSRSCPRALGAVHPPIPAEFRPSGMRNLEDREPLAVSQALKDTPTAFPLFAPRLAPTQEDCRGEAQDPAPLWQDVALQAGRPKSASRCSQSPHPQGDDALQSLRCPARRNGLAQPSRSTFASWNTDRRL